MKQRILQSSFSISNFFVSDIQGCHYMKWIQSKATNETIWNQNGIPGSAHWPLLHNIKPFFRFLYLLIRQSPCWVLVNSSSIIEIINLFCKEYPVHFCVIMLKALFHSDAYFVHVAASWKWRLYCYYYYRWIGDRGK